MNIKEILEKANKMIKEDEELTCLDDFKIGYVLIGKDAENNIVIAYNNDEMYQLNVEDNTYYPRADWDYYFDNDIFEELEKGKKIGYMNMETHYNIWCSIDNDFDEIEHTDGMNKYIEYCINNDITKETIDKDRKLDVHNIMIYYNKNEDLER